jgi:hypothetical protein
VRPSLRASLPLLCGLLVLAACARDVQPIREGEGGGDEAAQPAANLRVRVENPLAPLPGYDILVHTREGKLRSRTLSSETDEVVYAEPGDTVGLVWQQWDYTGDQGWLLDMVRVVEGMEVVRFDIDALGEPAPPNPPMRLEITTAVVDGVVEQSINAACDQGAITPPGETFVLDAYVGCAGDPESIVGVLGYDADGRLITFDTTTVVHGTASDVSVAFPMTPVDWGTPALTITWTGLEAPYLEAGAMWSFENMAYLASDTFTTFADPTNPVIYAPNVPLPSAGATAVVATAFEPDPTGSCFGRVSRTVHRAIDRTWTVDRLALADFLDLDAFTWSLTAKGERGDAVLVLSAHRTWHHFRWTEPPALDDATHKIVEPEIPEDLIPYFFSPTQMNPELWAKTLIHDDRYDVEGYVAYVADGVGTGPAGLLGGRTRFGEQRTTGDCDNR